MKLTGKVALVTGAAQGIGLGIATILAREDAAVVLTDILEDTGLEAATALAADGLRTVFRKADVTSEHEVRLAVEAAIEHFGRLDIVVNNAGTAVVSTVEESSVEEWDRIMAINVRSIFLTAKYAVRHMRMQGGGAIVNLGSVSSFVGQQSTPAYCASKGAVLMLTKSLAVDYGPDGIRVNCICPGITDTPLLRFHTRHAPDPAAHLNQRLQRVPDGTMLYPEDMGHAVAFLCSDAARGITGTSLLIDGGYLACAEFFR